MAKVDNNIFVRGLTGQVGEQFVIRKGRGGATIIANKPKFSANRTFNTGQLQHQDNFRMAIAYAKSAKDETIYLTKAQGTTMTAFNAAVADWFNKPAVLEINAEGWTGNPGEIIRIKAQDDTQVTKVRVQITDGTGVLEQGDAVAADGLWWEYTTTATVPTVTTATVKATAHDLPGNTHSLTWQAN